MDYTEMEIAQFVADQTGLPFERTSKILKLGEPWPFVQAFGGLCSRSVNDANATNASFGSALAGNSLLIDLEGSDALSPKAIDRHIEQTAKVTGEAEDIVRAVQSALHDLFRLLLDKVGEVIKKVERENV